MVLEPVIVQYRCLPALLMSSDPSICSGNKCSMRIWVLPQGWQGSCWRETCHSGYRAGKFRTRVMAKGLARMSPFFLVLQSVSRGWLRLSPRAPPSDSVPPVT